MITERRRLNTNTIGLMRTENIYDPVGCLMLLGSMHYSSGKVGALSSTNTIPMVFSPMHSTAMHAPSPTLIIKTPASEPRG